MKELLTTQEIATKFGASPGLVRYWIQQGQGRGVAFLKTNRRVPGSAAKFYTVITPDEEPTAPAPRRNAPKDYVTGGRVIPVDITRYHIAIGPSMHGIHSAAFALALMLRLPYSQVKILREEVLIWSRQPQMCSAGYLSRWISVPLPREVRTTFKRWADYGDVPYPLTFDLQIPKGYTL